MPQPKTLQEAEAQVAAANKAGLAASKITGKEFTAGDIASFFPGLSFDKKTEPLPTPTQTTDITRFSRLTPIEQKAEATLAAPLNVQSKEEIQAAKMKAAQAEIDALNKVYQDKLAEQRIINQGQERQTSAVSTLTGLAGSTEANVQATKTEALGNKQLDAIRNEQAAAVQAILSKVRTSAAEEARQQTLDARQSARDILDLRAQRAEEAVNDLTILSQTGITAEGLKTTDPEAYNAFVSKVGGENMLKAYLTLNRPQNTILDKKIENGKYVIAYQNPLTGETKVETVDLGLPPNYTKTVDAGDRILTIPDNWDGNPDSLITINKGLSPKEAQKTKGTTGPSEYSTERAIRTIQSVDELKLLAEANPGIFGKSAAVPIPDFARSEAFRNFEAQLDTLKSNIAFGELTAMREASKTGGALGQVSNIELGLLESALGALKMSQSPENFVKQLDKIKESIKRWQEKVKEEGGSIPLNAGGSEGAGTLTSPDGTKFVNIADLTQAELAEAKAAGWK